VEGAARRNGSGSYRADRQSFSVKRKEERGKTMILTGIMLVITAAFALWLLFNV
jgi:hypothetical protein